MTTPEIFISYSWANKKIADKIYYDLTFVGFKVVKDDHTLEYTDRISEFMKRIRKANFALILVCDNYLKSFNCMTEIMQLRKDEDIWQKILPVMCNDAKIYKPLERVVYISYWQQQASSIQNALKDINPINVTSTLDELKNYIEISQQIDSFLLNLKDRLNTTPEALFKDFYRPLTNRIGIEPDFGQMMQLVPICFIKDPHERLTTLNSFIEANKIDTPHTYSITGSCYRDMKNFEKAIQFYKLAVQYDDFDYAAWNNLGQVYESVYKNYDSAKIAYEKAIEAMPQFDIPRLNLGCLLSSHLNDLNGAKQQYEQILTFDENNPKAHNNLANIYRSSELRDLSKFEKHILIAVSQKNVEATLNYANYLKAEKQEIELGNSFYQKAREFDIDNKFGPLIDALMKTNKG
ncbi:toll/interleukin-1 receptor domain-containing protein [Sphingobacterium siyangense]|uniref:toll/interleukin-1 receptor domain-containing protein n=1 Tax=Sphingobacterium siyangense TaxID=459529 RepID=UPI0028A8D256|nr:TIR domain-containing protein [Sphingobacterium siyangense]